MFLAIDATAILPCLRVKGNRLIGIAIEDVFVQTAQDIIDITNDETKEKLDWLTPLFGLHYKNMYPV